MVLCRHLVVNLLGFEVQIFPECVERLRFAYGGIEKGIHGGNMAAVPFTFSDRRSRLASSTESKFASLSCGPFDMYTTADMTRSAEMARAIP